MFKFIRKISTCFAIFGLLSLIFISFIVILNALMRKFLNINIKGLSDVLLILSVFSIASILPAMILQKASITVRLIDIFLKKKISKTFEFWGMLVFTCFVIILAWQVGLYSWVLFQTGETSWELHLPLWPLWFFVSLSLYFSVFIQIIMIFFSEGENR